MLATVQPLQGFSRYEADRETGGANRTPDTTLDHNLERAINGDLDAFGEVVKQYESAVYNLAYRMLGNAGDAEDAAQEVFLRAYTSLHRYDPDRSFKTWILSITSNYCIDLLRKRRIVQVSLDHETLPEHPMLRSSEPTPEKLLLNNEREAQVQAMLDELKDEERLILILRYWYEMNLREIGDLLAITEGAVKSRLFRARQNLATQCR